MSSLSAETSGRFLRYEKCPFCGFEKERTRLPFDEEAPPCSLPLEASLRTLGSKWRGPGAAVGDDGDASAAAASSCIIAKFSALEGPAARFGS